MSTTARDLPETNEARHKALHLADNKRLSVPPAQNPLTANTTTRLINVLADYNSKTLAINTARTAYRSGTPGKGTAGDTLRLFISHFIQVFNLGVARGKYPAAHRSSYELPVDSSALPDLSKDSDLLMWANNLITGDALRLAAGGLPMANPDISEVQAALTVFHPLFTNQSTLKDAYDNTQEALDGIIPEIDKVIRKIWDELEAHYNEETPESRRENMREWGVVYITIGSSKVLSGTVTYNGAPGAGLSVRFKSGKSASICTAAGGYTLTTTLMGDQKVVVEKLDPNDPTIVEKSWDFEVTLNEDGDKTANFTVND
jgi:hypothetical protein